MANNKNLRTLSPSEARENGKKGGKKSGEKRRERKAMKEVLLEMLNLPIEDCGLEEFSSLKEIKGKNITAQQAMCVAMIKKAMAGDVHAATFVRDTSGNKPIDNEPPPKGKSVKIVDNVPQGGEEYVKQDTDIEQD